MQLKARVTGLLEARSWRRYDGGFINYRLGLNNGRHLKDSFGFMFLVAVYTLTNICKFDVKKTISFN